MFIHTAYLWKLIVAMVLMVCLMEVIVNEAATQAAPPSCSVANPEACLYTSDLNYAVGVIDPIILTDPARGNYSVPVLVRYPVGATGPRPVVIWHHGGHPSPAGRQRSAEWGNALAAAGYVVVHPARVTIQNVRPFLAECAANGITTPDTCAYWVTQSRYGVQNTPFVIGRFPQIMASSPALSGMLDPRKIVVAGHSAGSAVVLSNAGATQRWVVGGPTYSSPVPGVVAFLASGVQGPMYAGFQTGFQPDSFTSIDRPFMFITGVGDETGEPSAARTAAWLTAQPGDKELLWDNVPHAVHETMNIHKCDTAVRADHCRWIASAGLAFLDSVVRQRPEAAAWMASSSFDTLTSGAIEHHRR